MTVEKGHDELRASRPWLSDINEAKSDLRDEVEDVSARLQTDQTNLNNLNLTVQTVKIHLQQSNNEHDESRDLISQVSGAVGGLQERLDSINTTLRDRIENVMNVSRDMSVAHEDHQQNLFEVRAVSTVYCQVPVKFPVQVQLSLWTEELSQRLLHSNSALISPWL